MIRMQITILLSIIAVSLAVNKYSKEANQPHLDSNAKHNGVWTEGSEDAPFRMSKINQIWTKARKVSRLQ